MPRQDGGAPHHLVNTLFYTKVKYKSCTVFLRIGPTTRVVRPAASRSVVANASRRGGK
jgi:hypothetical protein